MKNFENSNQNYGFKSDVTIIMEVREKAEQSIKIEERIVYNGIFKCCISHIEN